jgi:hypothetical protein
MIVSPLRTYLSHGILVGLLRRRGEEYDHLVRPLLAARKELTAGEVAAADRRITSALGQLLGNAAPPALAHLERDGLAAVECDSYATELLPIYRSRLREMDAPEPEWQEAVTATLKRRADAAQERRAAATEARKARQAAQAHEGLDERIQSAVAERVADLYQGTWGAQRSYGKGDMVTDSGSLWICRAADTRTRPGNGDGWTLAVKRGRDGK